MIRITYISQAGRTKPGRGFYERPPYMRSRAFTHGKSGHFGLRKITIYAKYFIRTEYWCVTNSQVACVGNHYCCAPSVDCLVMLDFLDIPSEHVEIDEELSSLRNPAFSLPSVSNVCGSLHQSVACTNDYYSLESS